MLLPQLVFESCFVFVGLALRDPLEKGDVFGLFLLARAKMRATFARAA